MKYEEHNLKTYTSSPEDLEKFQLFKHPHKTEVKEKLDTLGSTLHNPYKTMKLWIRWEQLDIQALLEAVDIR